MIKQNTYSVPIVKGVPFAKLLWYAWYVLGDRVEAAVREEAKKYLEILIKCAIAFDIDQMSVEEISLTTFRLWRWEIDNKIASASEIYVALGYLSTFMEILFEEQLITVTPLSLKMAILN